MNKEILCYTAYLPEGAKQDISFMDILLDENWANGKIECPEEIFSETGDYNQGLSAKQDYEFLLRAASRFPVTAIGASPKEILSSSCSSAPSTKDLWNGFRTDCYIAGKYQKELISSGCFHPVMETLLSCIMRLPNPEEAAAWLEKMISHAPEYYKIDDNTRPILIYQGAETCYNTLNHFARELAEALLCLRQRVVIFDVEKEGYGSLTRFIGKRFKAVIGIQAYAFSNMIPNHPTNLHDLIHGPKYNMILDHPIWIKDHIKTAPDHYYLLTHDRNYLSFMQRYYRNIKGCFYFPPAGTLPLSQSAAPSPHGPDTGCKLYDITFIGTYRNYRQQLASIYSLPCFYRHFAARFMQILRQDPNRTAESAFQDVLDHYGMELNDPDFLRLFYNMRAASSCIMLYYREKAILTLLNAGIEVHVYSSSWDNAPFAGHTCLIRHPALSIEDSLSVMQQTRISLNIMSWHKDGLTERILNAMLCRSAVLSDKSARLEEEFSDGEDILLFDLSQLDTLPKRVKELLSDPARLQQIAENGCQKAAARHLWLHRAKELLDILSVSSGS